MEPILEDPKPNQFAPKEAWLYAAEWGSAMASGDPGACVYGFGEHCMVQSEEHRQDCLNWIEGCVKDVNADPTQYDDDELVKLGWLKKYLENAPLDTKNAGENLDEFTLAYIEAALWSTSDPDSPSGDRSLQDSGYTVDHFADATLAEFVKTCQDFQAKYGHLFTTDNCNYSGCSPTKYAGHDLWLTRTGSGCGFWDGDWTEPAATELTEGAGRWDGDLYPGDDGKLYT